VTPSGASPGNEAVVHRRGGHYSVSSPRRASGPPSNTSGSGTNPTFETPMLRVPTDAVRPISQCTGRGNRSWTMAANRGRVASLEPQNGRGRPVGLSKRIQDQTGVRKIGGKDKDKAGGKGEGVDLGVKDENRSRRDCAWNGNGDTRNEGLNRTAGGGSGNGSMQTMAWYVRMLTLSSPLLLPSS